MKRYVTLAVTCAMLTGAGQMLAETVSQKEASRVASLFSNASAGQVMGKPELAWNAKPLTTAKLFTPFYVYNLRNGGFVIVAADNKAFPILAYSRNGVFDADRLSDTQREWLRRYARDIEMIRYDSRVPDEAIAAWGDLSAYINELLKREPEKSGLHLFSATQAIERLEEVEAGEDSYLTESELYTPQQWQDMIDGEMRQRGQVIIGMEDAKGNMLPVELYSGGDGYYLLATENGSPDGTEPWIVRLNATEYLSGTMVADIGNPIEIVIPEPEEEPFVEHDAFMAEVASAPERRLAAIEESLRPSHPVIRGYGGAHYEISYPQDIILSTVYDMAGNVMFKQKYSESQTANFDLSILPQGLYVVLTQGADGTPYGVKLWR